MSRRALLVAAVAAAALACGDHPSAPAGERSAQIQVDSESITFVALGRGGIGRATATLRNADGTVDSGLHTYHWTTSDTLLWITDGVQSVIFSPSRAVKVPTPVVITVNVEGLTAKHTVTVVPASPTLHVTGLSFVEDSVFALRAIGASETLHVRLRGQSDTIADNSLLTWTSSDPAVADVAGGLVHMKSAGVATVRASVAGVTTSRTVVVRPPFQVFEVPESDSAYAAYSMNTRGDLLGWLSMQQGAYVDPTLVFWRLGERLDVTGCHNGVLDFTDHDEVLCLPTTDGVTHLAIWSPNSFRVLNDFPETKIDCFTAKMNARGAIAYLVGCDSSTRRLALWSPGSVAASTLNIPPTIHAVGLLHFGDDGSIWVSGADGYGAYHRNPSGQWTAITGSPHDYLTRGGDLAVGVTPKGDVYGYSWPGPSGFVWSESRGYIAWPEAIVSMNSRGEIAGSIKGSPAETYIGDLASGTMARLSDLVSDQRWAFMKPYQITDEGTVLMLGTRRADNRSVFLLLKPATP